MQLLSHTHLFIQQAHYGKVLDTRQYKQSFREKTCIKYDIICKKCKEHLLRTITVNMIAPDVYLDNIPYGNIIIKTDVTIAYVECKPGRIR